MTNTATTIDDGLYSGVNGASDLFPQGTEPTQAVKDIVNERKAISLALMPAKAIVTTVVDEELAKIFDLRSLLPSLKASDEPTTDDSIKAELRARELYMHYLESFKTTILNRLAEGANDE